MTTSSARQPIVVPPEMVPRFVADEIEAAVESFAAEKDLEVLAWYHDEPRWIARQRGPLTEEHYLVQVQVVGALRDLYTEPEIEVSARAQVVREGRLHYQARLAEWQVSKVPFRTDHSVIKDLMAKLWEKIEPVTAANDGHVTSVPISPCLPPS